MGKKIYNIGLDIGQTSVGWAVVDDNGHLMRHKGKNMWGVRLFDKGQTAATRRMYRSTRRRLARRKERINKLQEIFAEEINKNDKNFFIRLKESFLYTEDNSLLSTSILFDDKNYLDKDYYDTYPTIYHLRKDLMNATEKRDIRLVYLALHHILKYRGHFLYGKTDFSQMSVNIQTDLEFLFSKLFNDEYNITTIDFDKLKDILSSADKASIKQDKLQALMISKDKDINNKIKEIIKAILGYKFNLSKLFVLEEMDDINKKISFKEGINEEEIESILGEEIEVFHALKSIYSWVTLEELLGEVKSENPMDKTISNVMIRKYNNHKKELQMLKKLVKDICPQEYNNLFRNEGKDPNYTKYIKKTKDCSLEQFNKYIIRILNKYPKAKEHQYYSKIYEKLKSNQLLAKLNTIDNAVIPYQLHKIEMERIIDAQGKYYPFLLKNKTLLVKILVSKLPYYVGPLNSHSEFAWIEKKYPNQSHQAIYPWNYQDVIDIDKTAEKFILRMTNKCTYLKEEDVLPKYSLIYSEFVLLNELNKVRINGKLMDKNIKKQLIKDVFQIKKTVKTEDIIQWVRLNPHGFITHPSDEILVEGTQKENEFAASLFSYNSFKKLFGKIDNSNIKMIEEIIKWVTIFEDKEILQRKIRRKYNLKKEEIEKILMFNYSGWARLSKKLIDEIRTYKDPKFYGYTILDIMRETNYNFMQIINDQKFDFQDVIKRANPVLNREKVTYEDIKELQGSPAIKRGIWETVKIIKEIVYVMKCEPQNIFMEFARSDEVSKRTISRAKK